MQGFPSELMKVCGADVTAALGVGAARWLNPRSWELVKKQSREAGIPEGSPRPADQLPCLSFELHELRVAVAAPTAPTSRVALLCAGPGALRSRAVAAWVLVEPGGQPLAWRHLKRLGLSSPATLSYRGLHRTQGGAAADHGPDAGKDALALGAQWLRDPPRGHPHGPGSCSSEVG